MNSSDKMNYYKYIVAGSSQSIEKLLLGSISKHFKAPAGRRANAAEGEAAIIGSTRFTCLAQVSAL